MKRQKEKFQEFCVRCGSTDLKSAVTPWKSAAGQFFSGEAKCLNCGFEGIALQGTSKFIQEFKNSLVEK